MNKIEMPEELVSKLISAARSYATMEADMADIIRSDREAIRAECAERFVKAYRKDRISDETPAETEALRYYCDAIMAEAKE